jgi:Holliday junction DNA helicase RuvA
MIAMLKGIVEVLDGSHLIIDVAGVGYKVLVPSSLSTLEKGNPVKIFTYTHVREDALELYGFETIQDLKLFELLVSVSGVGPKTAVGIFSIAKGSEIKEAIITSNVAFFQGVPRLGKKNAQKIIIELKNKLGSGEDIDLSDDVRKSNTQLSQALKSIGFSPVEIQEALKSLDGKGETLEEKIKYALQYLGK